MTTMILLSNVYLDPNVYEVDEYGHLSLEQFEAADHHVCFAIASDDDNNTWTLGFELASHVERFVHAHGLDMFKHGTASMALDMLQ